MSSLTYGLAAISVTTIAAGQLIFKSAATRILYDGSVGYLDNARINIIPLSMIAAALVLYFFSTVLWIQVLRTIPLSIAFMFNAFAFVMVPVASFFLFGENVPRYFIMSTVLITTGIVLLTW